MINEIDTLIQEARKSKKQDVLLVLQAIKSEFSKVIHSGVNLDSAKEYKILTKMMVDRTNSAKLYRENGREDLAKIESNEALIINKYIPEQPSDHDIAELTKKCISDYMYAGNILSMKSIKDIIAMVHKTYPAASSSIISKVVKGKI